MGSQNRNLGVRRGPKSAIAHWRHSAYAKPSQTERESTEEVAAGPCAWAEFRLSVIGHLIACVDHGQIRTELNALSAKKWKHPITGEQVSFSFSTIER